MKKILTLMLLGLLSGFSVIAQDRTCSTMDVLEQNMKEDPGLAGRMALIEEQIKAKSAELSTPEARKAADLITIPVVIHIVYSNARENISDAQIQSQMDVINEDFRRLNADRDNSWSQAADVDIEFCLATVDPNGNPTTGITRKSSSRTGWGQSTDLKSTARGGVSPWNTREYMNMWVCNLGSGLLGYAQFPGGNAATDGVVMLTQSFGSSRKGNGFYLNAPFDLGRTTTHEIGHYLGLRHIWGDSNCGNDQVADTPTQQAASGGCPIGNNSCGSRDMVQNYMDYSNDSCMNLFTQGQTDRMRAVMTGTRSSLANSNKCGVTVSLPTSGFDAEVACNDVSFTNTSSANATSYSWNFGDGNTSTQENPTHTYASAGTFTVRLTVSNSVGSDLTQSTVTTAVASAPRDVNETICTGTSASVEVSGNGGFVWYDQPTGGNIVAVGSSYETEVLSADKTYYVAGTSDEIENGNLGKEDIASGGNHVGGFYLVFDATETIILKKAKVQAEGAGQRTLELRDASGTLLQSKVITIADGESVIDINMEISAGTDMQIGFTDGANLYRSNANVNFPYTFDDIAVIKRSTATSNPVGFYYYLYNWEVSAIGNCISEDRGQVIIDVTNGPAQPTLDANQSTGVITVSGSYSSYQWFKDGETINGATSNTYTANENGTYTVEVSSGSCETLSEEVIIDTLSTDSYDLPASVSIYPIPALDVLNIRGLNTLEDVKQIRIVSMLGQIVKEYNLNTVLETTTLNVQSLSNGIYFLNIDNKYAAKFVVK